MNLRHLRAFRAVMMCGTVTEAARRLCLTQSATSRLLSGLENEIGFRLFTRYGRRLIPTPEGQAFFTEAERILLGIDEIVAIAGDIRTHRSARLRLAAIPLLAHGLLPKALAAFTHRYPTVHSSFVMPRQWDFGSWIAGYQFDLGLTVLPMEHPFLRSEVFADVAGVVALPPGHRLCSRARLGVRDLADEPLITQPQHALMRNHITAVFDGAGLSPNIRTETVSGFTACQLVAQGLGVAIVDAFSASAFAPGQIHIVPWTEPLQISCAFIFPVDRQQSTIARDFQAVVCKVMDDLMAGHPHLFRRVA